MSEEYLKVQRYIYKYLVSCKYIIYNKYKKCVNIL